MISLNDLISLVSNTFYDILAGGLTVLSGFCPLDGVVPVLEGMGEGLNWLNWIVPLAELLVYMSSFVTCLATWYLISFIIDLANNAGLKATKL